MPLTPRQLAQAAYVVGEELARRKRTGIPIHPHLVELHHVLLTEVSATGHLACETPTTETRLETAQQRAQRLGVSERTIRRRAAARGEPRIGNRYLFERH